jgi:hypothetical protein
VFPTQFFIYNIALADELVKNMPVLLNGNNEHESKFTIEAALPETVRKVLPFVMSLIFEIVTVPALENVQLPDIVTFGVSPSPVRAVRLTPAFKAGFSVYVPGLMSIVCPLEAALIAA